MHCDHNWQAYLQYTTQQKNGYYSNIPLNTDGSFVVRLDCAYNSPTKIG
jgi:hypothetical protein